MVRGLENEQAQAARREDNSVMLGGRMSQSSACFAFDPKLPRPATPLISHSIHN